MKMKYGPYKIRKLWIVLLPMASETRIAQVRQSLSNRLFNKE